MGPTDDREGNAEPARTVDVPAHLLDSSQIIICEGYPTELQSRGLAIETLAERVPGAVLVYLSPFGQSGPLANRHANDLTLLSASGITRMLTGQVDDLSQPPVTATGQQSAFIGGIAAACAGMNLLLSDGSKRVADISIHEALTTLAITELARAGTGESPWQRKRLTDGNGATVCVLPTHDGYVAVSPREDHQWQRWLGVMGSPEWGDEPEFRTKRNRIENWDRLYAHMCRWSESHGRREVARMAQQAHVPSFPLLEPWDQIESSQLDHRGFFAPRAIDPADDQQRGGATLKVPTEPFHWSVASSTAASVGARTHRRLPLSGIRVLDFSWVIAGPTATRYLAEFGAEVIKIEAPGRGDPGRATLLHQVLGQGKQSIAIDLKSKRGVELVKALARKADVVIENYATGVMDRLGLGVAALRSENPNIVYLSASGTGRTGPESKAVAYGTLLQCYCGFAALNRHPDSPPRVGMAWLDPMCGLMLAFATAAALHARENAKLVARIDFSMLEAMLWTLAQPLIRAQRGNEVRAAGNASESMAPHGIYPSADRLGPTDATPKGDQWIAIAIESDAEWQQLCDAIPALAHLRALTTAERQRECEAIDRIIAQWTGTLAATDAESLLSELDIPAASVADASDLVQSEHLRERSFWLPAGDHQFPGYPWRLSIDGQAKTHSLAAAPALSEHADDILRRLLGMTAREAADLRGAGVVE
jgi:crotonobetainyl-CoA:carnitine CoA-transferase CaiB-like acyl-CoA transferase